jgi:hypothetical protein
MAQQGAKKSILLLLRFGHVKTICSHFCCCLSTSEQSSDSGAIIVEIVPSNNELNSILVATTLNSINQIDQQGAKKIYPCIGSIWSFRD